MKVTLQGVHKVFGRGRASERVLDDVHLTVANGDFIALMGPSGSGKSTLLNLMGCLDFPSFGQIFLEDRDVSKVGEAVRERIRLNHIGFVFQSYNLLPSLSVVENILLPMQLAGVRTAERRGRAQSLLSMVGLESQAKQSVTVLSGGQQQKVAVARALANLPGLLLADEPTGSLDARSTQQVMKMLQEVNRSQSVTTVLVTHDPQVAAYARQVYSIENGALILRDSGGPV